MVKPLKLILTDKGKVGEQAVRQPQPILFNQNSMLKVISHHSY